MTGISTRILLLRKAAALLAVGDDGSWDDLLPIVEHFELHDQKGWQDLAVASLEAMVAHNACEALQRDPWSSLAPLMTRLLRQLARHVPQEQRRAAHAIVALFDRLRLADPITLPDGLPGAAAALAIALPEHRSQLVAAVSKMLDGQRMCHLLMCGRTTRQELRSLRCVADDRSLVAAIDRALDTPGASRNPSSVSSPLIGGALEMPGALPGRMRSRFASR